LPAEEEKQKADEDLLIELQEKVKENHVELIRNIKKMEVELGIVESKLKNKVDHSEVQTIQGMSLCSLKPLR